MRAMTTLCSYVVTLRTEPQQKTAAVRTSRSRRGYGSGLNGVFGCIRGVERRGAHPPVHERL
jgi:hypothetical protein